MLQTMLQQTLQEEFTRFLGAAPFERTDARAGVRNGTRPRTLVTRVGTVALQVPRDRASLFEPTVFVRYQRHEQALVCTLAECYLQGVSTRKVRHLVETLCGETVSASTVSRATKQLDAALAEWRTRRVDVQAYPQLIIDAHYERIRREGQVLSTAVLWVLGVAANGYREYLGVWVGNAESGPVWSAVFRDLHRRGLHGVQYVVSDEHAGLKTAVQRYFPRGGASALPGALPAECARQGEHARAPGDAPRRLAGCLGRPHPGHGGAARGNAHPDAAPTSPPSLSG
ncbi:MAG: IS256 family transposase [Gemmatimonadetes bacterium]|nr:IS256 family transposase [Gemmatimonadota bacterium]